MMRNRDDGAVTLEAALVTGLLVMIAIGAFEFGMAFQSFFGVASSSREAARVGASIVQGDPSSSHDADCRILEAAGAALQASNDDKVVRVRILNHDPVTDTDIAENRYRPSIASDDVDLLVCGNWFPETTALPGWPESSRTNTGVNRDWIGVEVEYEHAWITGFAWWSGSINWSNRSTMHLEPVSYG